MKLNTLTASVLTCAAMLTGFAAHSEDKEQPNSVDEVSILAYNVENLFDTKQDNPEDITYLPLSNKKSKDHFRLCLKISNDFYRDECMSFDWNEKILATKISRIVEAVLAVDNGVGPDILIVEEVENIAVLGQLMAALNKRLPANKAYHEPILLEGWDDRGIDIGMMSRLERTGEVKISPVKMDGKIIDSRGILHAVFVLPGGEKLNVFGVHFPSGGNPTPHREAAVAALNAEFAKLPDGALAVTGGDFNINTTEDAVHKLYSQQLGQNWLVSHLIGCKQCVGTEFFQKEQSWSFLDALLFTKNMSSSVKSGWVVDEESIDVPNKGPEQTWQGKPSRFSAEHGVSDHWPIFAKLRRK